MNSTLPASRFLLSLAILGATATAAYAVEPSVSSLTPYGFQRGTEVELTLRGARLDDAQEIMLYEPGVTVSELKPANATTVKARLKVAPDCRLGIHALRVRSATGVSDLRTFSVGALPELSEKEPNSDFEKPQPVPLGATINGTVENEDLDYFVVEAKKGQRVVAELEGLRLGNTFFDPYVAILNEKRFELARSDDSPLLRQDSLCAIVAPEDGRYIVQVRESSYGGSGACKYRLHVGSFPRPLATLPSGGKPGETVEMRLLGDPAGERVEKVTLPSTPREDHPVFARDEHGIAPSPNRVRVQDLTNVLETEPNNDRSKATPFTAPAALGGVIAEEGDHDYFKFAAKKGQRYDIRVFARNVLRSPLDAVLYVYNSKGSRVASNDDSGGPDSYTRFTAPADDDYLIMVRDHLRSGGPNYVYRIEVAPVAPTLTLGLPEKVRYVSTTLAVPKGNRMALLVSARRENFGGEVALDFKDLPAGVTAQAPAMAANRTDVPVLFTATPDAPLAGKLVDVVGRTTDPKLKVEGRLRQRTMLVRGQNNRDVWGHDADRMATVVTNPAPFSIEIVQPKAPLVRNGSMGLKVIAKRAEGFKAPIAVTMLYNPPGVGSSGSIRIAEDKNEAVIPLTANSSAEIRKWPIVVVGRASVGGGNMETASQMAELEVADRFFDLAFTKAAVEQGQTANVIVKITKKRDFEGDVQARLVGLPTGAKAEPLTFNKDTGEIVFHVTTEKNARVGRHRTLLCRAVATVAGEPVTHTLGTGELRIDKPLPPKVVAKKPAPKPVAKAPAKKPTEPPKKRLSRLEMLRLEREKAKKAGE